MPYWRECPKCGSHLDPGERCDCESLEKTGASEVKSIRRPVRSSDLKIERRNNHEPILHNHP